MVKIWQSERYKRPSPPVLLTSARPGPHVFLATILEAKNGRLNQLQRRAMKEGTRTLSHHILDLISGKTRGT